MRLFWTEPNKIHSEPNPDFFQKTEPKSNRNVKKSIPHISSVPLVKIGAKTCNNNCFSRLDDCATISCV